MANGTTTKTKTSTAVKVIVGIAILGLGAYAVANLIIPTVSKPTPRNEFDSPVIVKEKPPSNALLGGKLIAYRFTVKAPPRYDIALRKVAFFVTRTAGVSIAKDVTSPAIYVSNVNIPGYSVIPSNEPIPATATMTTSGSDCGAAASLLKVCIRVTFNDKQVITATSSQTFDLSLFIIKPKSIGNPLVGAPTDTSNLSLGVTLLGDATAAAGALSGGSTGTTVVIPPNGVGGTQYNFLWSNSPVPGQVKSTDNWLNGYGVSGLPSAIQNFTDLSIAPQS